MADELLDQCKDRLADPTWTFMPFHRDDLAELVARIERAEGRVAALEYRYEVDR